MQADRPRARDKARAQPRRRGARQLGFAFRTWGGKRAGAGRKAKRAGAVSHTARPLLASKHPVHVSLSVEGDLPGLRRPDLCEQITRCLREARDARLGLRVVHYSVQQTHLHLIVEAKGREALSLGMQGLSIRIAKRLNRALGRKGRVFRDRYFARILRSPRQTREALRYVLLNARRHAGQAGMRCARGWVDPCSSGPGFDGWRGVREKPPPDPSVSAPHTWLLSRGWRRHGRIPVDDVPGAPRGR